MGCRHPRSIIGHATFHCEVSETQPLSCSAPRHRSCCVLTLVISKLALASFSSLSASLQTLYTTLQCSPALGRVILLQLGPSRWRRHAVLFFVQTQKGNACLDLGFLICTTTIILTVVMVWISSNMVASNFNECRGIAQS